MDNAKQEDNLSKFGPNFQTKCITALLSDRAFLERITDVLLPEQFETDAHKWIIKLILDYFPKYKNIPTYEVLTTEIKKIPDNILQTAVYTQIVASINQAKATDIQYIKEEFLQFCKIQKYKNAIWLAQEFWNKGDYIKIQSVINEAFRAGSERNLGHDYYTDIEHRLCENAREVIKTNWPIIDFHLDGGLGKGELGFVVAPAGSGKSWCMTHIGGEAIKQGKNVLHVTLELNEKYVGLRYDSYFSGISFQEVRKNQDHIKNKVIEIKNNGGGNLYIKYFPTKSITAAQLKMYIDQFELISGTKIDLLILDYADLLKSSHSKRDSGSYDESGGIAEELRWMAGELQIPIWTVSQSNRGAHESELVEAGAVAESYKKVMTGDFICSLSRTMQDKVAGTGRIYLMKSRFGSDGIIYPCTFDASNGRIEIYDAKSVEGVEIMNKVKSEEENIKEIFKRGWNEAHKGKKKSSSDSE